MRSHLPELASAARGFLTGRPTESVSAWCERNLVFDEPRNRGPYSLRGREYMREPLDSWGDPTITDAVPVTGSQAGKTAMIMGGAAWKIIHNPGRFFWVMPTRPTVLNFSRTRWQKMLVKSPATAALLPPGNRRFEFATFQQILGASIVDMVWSNSPAALSSTPATDCILDEVDKFDQGAGAEADAVNLAEQRTKDAGAPFKVKTSTPTLVSGLIWQELEKTDLRRYFVPCPHCGKHVVFAWSPTVSVLEKTGAEAFVYWDKEAKLPSGDWDLERVRQSAHYLCPHCTGEIRDQHRRAMVRDGEWRPTKKGTPGYRGWHLPSFYAPSAQCDVSALAVKWLTAKRSFQGVKGMINGDFAEPYVAQENRSERRELVVDRIELVDGGRNLLTADVQAKAPFFWYVVRNWKAGNSLLLDRGSCNAWEELDALQAKYEIPDLGVAVDSGWGNRDEAQVYRECFQRGTTNGKGFRACWMPTKGNPGRKTWKNPATKTYVPWLRSDQDPFRGTSKGGQCKIDLYLFSTDAFKDILDDLRKGELPWKWIVPAELATDEYWRHLDAETKKPNRNGRDLVWQARSAHWPNHLLDCEVLQVFFATFHRLFPLDFEPIKATNERKATITHPGRSLPGNRAFVRHNPKNRAAYRALSLPRTRRPGRRLLLTRTDP